MSEGAEELGLPQGQVRLCEPTLHWIALFAEEAGRLNAALRTFEAAVEHCGSTSIPGVPAKPILEILVGIPGKIDTASLRDALTPLGYEHATWAGVPRHEVFGKGNSRTHLVHVVPRHGSAWDRMIGFRDALRRDASLAAEYSELKRQLAAQFPNNRRLIPTAKPPSLRGFSLGEETHVGDTGDLRQDSADVLVIALRGDCRGKAVFHDRFLTGRLCAHRTFVRNRRTNVGFPPVAETRA